MAPCDLELAVPAGFAIGEARIAEGDDRHTQGRLAAARALALLGVPRARLGYEGARPIVIGAELAISITHGRARALAIAGFARRVGVDLCDDADRLARLAERYLAAERSIATTPRAFAACFAGKEAALKALGLGLLDGGVFDDCAVRVVSLDPPRLEPARLELVLGRVPEGSVAIAYEHP